jgi:hypothetical protein
LSHEQATGEFDLGEVGEAAEFRERQAEILGKVRQVRGVALVDGRWGASSQALVTGGCVDRLRVVGLL